MKLWISGACGFMGRAIAAAAAQAGAEIVGGIDPRAQALDFPVYASFDEAPAAGDVIIDFSNPAALTSVLRYARANRLPLVLGTTGLSEAQLAEVSEAAKEIAVFRSGNMSLGIALLRALSRKAAQTLGGSYDIEIIEAHHNRKLDAPSGTALMLYDAVKDAAGEEKTAVYGRCGQQKRTPGEIGIHAVRGGTIVGEHQVGFFGPNERIVLSHSAENRSVFANGAVRAAFFLQGKPAGSYSMDDLIEGLV